MSLNNDFWAALDKKKKKEIEEELKRQSSSQYTAVNNSEINSALSWRDDEIAPVKEEAKKTSQTVETTQAIFDKYGKYYNSSDYDKYSKQGAAIKNPTLDEAQGWMAIGNYQVGGKKVGNIVTYSRDNQEAIGMGEFQGSTMVGKSKYRHMTDFEVGVYNYLLAKEGKDAAQNFLDDIDETLNARDGGQMAEAIQNTGGVASTILHGGASFFAGAESAGRGIKQLFSEEALPTTSLEFTNQKLLEDLDGFAKTAYQAGNTVGNQFPFVVIGGINPTAGRLIQSSSAAGNAYRDALKEGKNKDEAAGYGVMIGGLEFVTSKLLSGFSGMTGDIPEKALSKVATFENALLRVGAKYGISIGSEIAEEEVQLWAEPLARTIAFGEDYDAPEIEEMAETAIVTAISTGILNSTTDVATGNLTKVNGLTQHEAKVIEAEVKNRVAEKEKNGTKLTKKEIGKIEEQVQSDLDKGYISVDTIEEVLGGKSYESYKSALDSENADNERLTALTDEYNTLNKKKWSDMTGEEQDRREELKKLIPELKQKVQENEKLGNSKKLKEQLGKDVYEMVKDRDRLVESYNEIARKKQAFDADLTQYTGKQKESVERAIKSGVLNNTYRSHEFVNLLSKIEADKGIVFDYTNNKKLMESGFALEGKRVNGFVHNGTVTVNVDSKQAYESVVGHEITHILEGTEAYSELKNALFAYAESKGELESRKASLAKRYSGMDADLDAELTADLVGDYIFTDTDFIRNLTAHKNVFQKIYDEIKYLCKVATGKELTEIEKVKREFDKAWKEFSTEGINEELNEATDSEIDDVQYSVSVEDEKTLDFLNEQVSRGEYNAETNPDGGYYVTYKSMSYWGTDEDGNAILRSPMAEYVDGELSNAYLIPKDKSKLNWYQSTETIDEKTGLPAGLMVKTKKEGNKSFTYLPAAENQDLIAEDWSNLYFNLQKKVLKNGKWVKSDVPARYNPYEHSSNSMLNDQFSAAYLRDNLVTVKMYVPISEDNGAFRAKWSKDPTGWADWKTGTVAGKINKQKDLQRKVYLSRYAAPVEIVPDSEVAQAYKEYIDGTDVTIPDNVVSPNLLKELRNAGVPITESGKVTSKGGVEYDKTSKSYSPVKYSISSWDKSDYVTERQQAAKEMSKTLGVTEEKASKYIDDVNSIAKMIADDKERLSYEPSPNRSAFVSNAEYGGSIDFSTICKKRRLFTGTFEAIQNALPNTALTADEVLEIRKMMKDKGYEVSCGLCYVEGSRTNMGQYTKQFIERYKATNPEYVPNMAEMNTATGQEKIRKEHPEVYEAYEYFMNHYGRLSPTDKALFASQQKPKMYQMSTEYKGEILDNFGKKKESVDAKNRNGGLRLQSFSDFEIIHLIDSMQVIMDMSRVGLAGQAYTKVPDFAWALGDTGLKINLSLIAKGVDENGRLVLDEVEGMKESDAMALRDRYSDNVGTILVAFNDEQLKAAMADERIDYIIPYHRSQWKTDQYEMMGLPENTKDYTPYQNESYIEPVYNKNGKKQRPNNYMPNNYWDFNKSGKENAEAYLQMCAENNRKPKFSHLLVDNQDGSYSLQPDGSTDGYWKTLIDFKMYNNDGMGVPQNPVTPDFNMEEAKRMLSEYTGGHAKFPVAKDIVDEFVSKHPDNIAPADVKYSISEDIQKSDADYLAAVESGDTETAQMMVDEAAKNAGYTRKLYHGTASKFNVFGFGRTGIFTTDNYDMAKTYGDNVISLYGKEGANVLTIDAQESPHWAIKVSKDVLDFSEYPLIGKKETYSTNDISLIAFREGYDVVVINNVYDNYSVSSGNTENGLGTDVVYKDPNQVKSSEAITYDDEGNVIPLSKRFNAENDDFRYSLSELGEQPSSVGTPLNELRFDPSQDDIAPVKAVAENATTNEMPMPDGFAPKSTDILSPLRNMPILPDDQLESGSYAAIRPQREKQPSMKKVGGANAKEQVANVLTEKQKVEKPKDDTIGMAVRNFVSKGAEIENLALKTGNRELQALYSAIRRSDGKAQYFMENGTDGVKPLKEIINEVEQTGQVGEFFDYIYHKHNVDRMSLEAKELPNLKRLEGEMEKLKLLHLKEEQLRAIASEKITKETSPKRKHLLKTVREYLASKDVKNKPVFGYSVTAEMSRNKSNEYEKNNPKFKEYAQDVYNLMNYLRAEMVENGVISQETADLWAKIYPHYVPIHRADANGAAVNVALDTNKTGINAPIKRATGGNKKIDPMFHTIADRVLQTYKAIAKNRFGVELKNTLGSVGESSTATLDDAIDGIDAQDDLLKDGNAGQNPTFTVFEDGKRVTFDVNKGIFEALKPTSEGLSKTYTLPHIASKIHKGLLTQYNLFFTARNFPKDAQSVMLHSQHPLKTYGNFPTAFKHLLTNGEYATEYYKNGGKTLTYFDKNKGEFVKNKATFRKVLGFLPDKISEINDFVEAIPRLAEYIASRKEGKTVEGAMLDASRVTTDFSDGGDVTKFFNRNGVTFLNASVQGAAQNIRDIREAKANGFKGIMKLVGKYAVSGLPVLLFNAMMWDDDEEYEELSDYVKDNYYIVAKYGDGQFVRIPKGREAAVIQEVFEQIGNTVSGDETDWGNVFTLAASNLAPNNPLENNVVAPAWQAFVTEKTWYGEDLIPTRLQDVPAEEQYDETIDSISKWLGENTGVSPYKINYVLNQYSGFVGDIALPYLTPEVESGNSSKLGNVIAPLADQFIVDGTMKNQNVSDFYDKVDELTVNANSSKATDEDILKSKYINSVNTEIGKLYGKKREIQNSNLSDATKYSQVKDVQDQINALARESLNAYNSVSIDGGYATVGDKHYRLEDGTWTKISDKQLERQQEVTSELGISPSEYWSKTEISYFPTSDGEYEYAFDNPEKYAVAKAIGGYDSYRTYSKALYNIKADKDANGKSINGSRKAKVIDYVNSLDIDYGARLILLKSEYPSDDSYNMDIINYINENDNLTYDERVTILEELGFKIVNGQIYWD